MPEMQKAMAKLRLMLASIKGKEDELESLKRQFQRQLDRTSTHAVQGGNSLDATIGIMEEIQERLDNVEMKQRHLASIKKRAEAELGALDLTDKIEKAKAELASLKERQNSDENGEEVELPSVPVNDEQNYEVVRPPVGVTVPYLPDEAGEKTIGGKKYFVYEGTYYRPFVSEGETIYMVVEIPE